MFGKVSPLSVRCDGLDEIETRRLSIEFMVLMRAKLYDIYFIVFTFAVTCADRLSYYYCANETAEKVKENRIKIHINASKKKFNVKKGTS